MTQEALHFLREEFRVTESLYRSAVLAAKSQEREYNEACAELKEAERTAMQIQELYTEGLTVKGQPPDSDSESEGSESDANSDDSEHQVASVIV